jgi:hypothetical protein
LAVVGHDQPTINDFDHLIAHALSLVGSGQGAGFAPVTRSEPARVSHRLKKEFSTNYKRKIKNEVFEK